MKPICILLLMLLSEGILFSQIYSYPIKPGTTEWSKLESEKERKAALQIPDTILSKMSTSELVQVCLNYPAFFQFTLYNDLQTGMYMVCSQFNGLLELMQRKDAGRELLDIYSVINANGYNNESLLCTEEYWPLRYMFIELLLAQEPIIFNMPENLRKQLLSISWERIVNNQDSELYTLLYDYQSTALIMTRLLRKLDMNDYNNKILEYPDIEQFNTTGNLCNVQTLKSITDFTDSFLKENK